MIVIGFSSHCEIWKGCWFDSERHKQPWRRGWGLSQASGSDGPINESYILFYIGYGCNSVMLSEALARAALLPPSVDRLKCKKKKKDTL